MAEVDHHLGRKTRFRQTDFHLRHVLRAVVRLFAAAQNNMAVAVTAGIHDGGVAPLGDRQETVRRAGGVNRIDSHLDGAIGTVFKAHRAGESGGELTVHLGFGGSRANGAPAHQIGDILRGDHIEEFPRRRQAAVVNVQQQFARDAQPVVDAEAVIHMGIVDEPFPADGGARFFKIDPHDDLELALQRLAQGQQAGGILFRRCRIVNRTRPNHHQQTVIVAFEDLMDSFASMCNGVCSIFGSREFFQERNGR